MSLLELTGNTSIVSRVGSFPYHLWYYKISVDSSELCWYRGIYNSLVSGHYSETRRKEVYLKINMIYLKMFFFFYCILTSQALLTSDVYWLQVSGKEIIMDCYFLSLPIMGASILYSISHWYLYFYFDPQRGYFL